MLIRAQCHKLSLIQTNQNYSPTTTQPTSCNHMAHSMPRARGDLLCKVDPQGDVLVTAIGVKAIVIQFHAHETHIGSVHSLDTQTCTKQGQ